GVEESVLLNEIVPVLKVDGHLAGLYARQGGPDRCHESLLVEARTHARFVVAIRCLHPVEITIRRLLQASATSAEQEVEDQDQYDQIQDAAAVISNAGSHVVSTATD